MDITTSKQVVKDHWKLALISLLIATVLVSLVQLANTKEDLKKHKALVAKKDQRIATLENSLEGTRSLMQECQSDVETAWKAFKRRNDLFVDVLNSPLDPSAEFRIQLDNETANEEIDDATSCNPLVSSDLFGE